MLPRSRDDLVFANVGTDARGVENRSWICDGVVLWVAVLLTPLTVAIQGLSNLNQMAHVFPVLRPFAEEPRYAYARSLVTGYVPVLLMLLVLILVPIWLEYLGRHYVKFKSRSAIQTFVHSGAARGCFECTSHLGRSHKSQISHACVTRDTPPLSSRETVKRDESMGTP